MRLLKQNEHGELTITTFHENELPPYAILSHTWGGDTDEVIFADLVGGDNKEKQEYKKKPGYKKIRLCGEQAQQDGLMYFWVDTCCIDKSDKGELSISLRSMFRWYQKATRCYAYLADVSTKKRKASSDLTDYTWEPSFRSSRWFTRGWTLQELLAPRTVEFFSEDWERLGERTSLKSLIYKITSIPHEVLEGAPLHQFSVDERYRWRQNRHTKVKEDAAYSMSGIFDVDMAPNYGEGAEQAFGRLHTLIQEQKAHRWKLDKCLEDLRVTDPCADKERIQETKGGLLVDSYHWILDNATFRKWRQDPQSRLLWIKGDPGKGKTMLLCGIIDELQRAASETALVAYFFCQATDLRINNATAVLRGLLYMLVSQQPSLVSHIRKKHDRAGKALFEDANAWVALTEIFVDMLPDLHISTTYLAVDALDECVVDLPKLLNFIAKHSSASSQIKWIVSSRNLPDIEEQLEQADHKIRLSLELNAESVSAAVSIFIQHKVSELARQKKYDKQTQDAVFARLTFGADGTFLWVALVCQDLRNTKKWNALKKLDSFPPELGPLYERMMQQIRESDDAELCKQILALEALVHRPLMLDELVALVEPLRDATDEDLLEIVNLCGSFLTLRKDTVYFVHQSAKDFLLDKASGDIFPNGAEKVHQAIFTKSLAILSSTLHRDMYGLNASNFPVDDVARPNPDPLAASCYPCIYWIDHLHSSKPKSSMNSDRDLQITSIIDTFLRRKYLYWLEGLSLLKSVGKGVVSIAKLQSLVQVWYTTDVYLDLEHQDEFAQLIHDAQRFVLYHKGMIESYPLQTYASALLFSPTTSLIRRLFQHEAPKDITIKPGMSDNWSTCLQTLEGNGGPIKSVAFSHNSTLLAMGLSDGNVKIWDLSSCSCLHILKGHVGSVTSVDFSRDSAQLASVSWDEPVRIWDTNSGLCLKTMRKGISVVAFSRDSATLACNTQDYIIKGNTVDILDVSSGEYLHKLKGHRRFVNSVSFSHDSAFLASGSDDTTVRIWNISSGVCLQTLRHGDKVKSLAFSHDSARLASVSYDSFVRIWDSNSGNCLRKISTDDMQCDSITFSHDSKTVAVGLQDYTIRTWVADSGKYLQTLKGHTDTVQSVAFSHNSAILASASSDGIVRIWDTSSSSSAKIQTLEEHGQYVNSVVFSQDLARLASASLDGNIKIWNASSGQCLQTFRGHIIDVCSVIFWHNLVASQSLDSTVKIWDTDSGACLRTFLGHDIKPYRLGPQGSFPWTSYMSFSHHSGEFAVVFGDNTVRISNPSNSTECLQILEGHSAQVNSVAFSGNMVGSASDDGAVKIWDASSGECIHTFEGHGGHFWSVTPFAFSQDTLLLASASRNGSIYIWNLNSGECLHTLRDSYHTQIESLVFSNDSSMRLASASNYGTVILWSASSGACLQTFHTQSSICRLSFNQDCTSLITERFSVVIPNAEVSCDGNVAVSEQPKYIGASLSEDGIWIGHDGHDTLWLPPEYRPTCSAVCGSTICIGTGSGKVWFCNTESTAAV